MIGLGLPELLIGLVVFAGPLLLAYRLGYNAGYRKGIDRVLPPERR